MGSKLSAADISIYYFLTFVVDNKVWIPRLATGWRGAREFLIFSGPTEGLG